MPQHVIRPLIPLWARRYRTELLMKRVLKRYEAQNAGRGTQEVFERIYSNGTWGASDDGGQPFFSGGGSHESSIVEPYIEAVSAFLRGFEPKLDAVDLGCGDFSVGSRIRHLCGGYTACDIVRPLIDHNRREYRALDVDFRVVDLTADKLPGGDVVFLRQVLQHLSNDGIAKATAKIAETYRFLVLTEVVPDAARFKANVDMPTGPHTRANLNSGIVLTKPPFDLKVKGERKICEVRENGALIVTLVYEL